jgi:hypothetical protein
MFALYRFQRCAFDKNLRRVCLQAEVFIRHHEFPQWGMLHVPGGLP